MEPGFLGSEAVLIDAVMLNTARCVCVKTHGFMHHKNGNGANSGLQPCVPLAMPHSKDVLTGSRCWFWECA